MNLLIKILILIENRVASYKNIFYRDLILKNAKEYTLPLRVNGVSQINEETYLGKNVNFNGMKILGTGKVKIGDNFHSGKGCKILTQIHNYEGEALPYDEKIIAKETLIGDNVWFGDDVTVLGGVIIGNGVIIQAGSVVVSNIPDLSIAGGHPAEPFKKRNEQHYNKLLKEEKFH